MFSIALEVPIPDIFMNGIPHDGTLEADSTDSLDHLLFVLGLLLL